MALSRYFVSMLILLGVCARGDDVGLFPEMLGYAAPEAAGARFLKLDGPAATLRWKDRLAFPISEDSFQRLAAAAKSGPLYLRIYAGTADQLKSEQATVKGKEGPDLKGCISFFHLERSILIRLTRARGVPMLVTDTFVPSAWFDEPNDMHVMAVVDEGRLPRWPTRIHKELVGRYFDSGMPIAVLARSAANETVSTKRRDSTSMKREEAAAGKPTQTVTRDIETRGYLGDLIAFVPGNHMEIRDPDSKKVERIPIAGYHVETQSPERMVKKRVYVIVVFDTPPRVSIRESDYPDCIMPANQSTLVGSEFTLVSMVQRCEAMEGGLPIHSSHQ